MYQKPFSRLSPAYKGDYQHAPLVLLQNASPSQNAYPWLVKSQADTDSAGVLHSLQYKQISRLEGLRRDDFILRRIRCRLPYIEVVAATSLSEYNPEQRAVRAEGPNQKVVSLQAVKKERISEADFYQQIIPFDLYVARAYLSSGGDTQEVCASRQPSFVVVYAVSDTQTVSLFSGSGRVRISGETRLHDPLSEAREEIVQEDTKRGLHYTLEKVVSLQSSRRVFQPSPQDAPLRLCFVEKKDLATLVHTLAQAHL